MAGLLDGIDPQTALLLGLGSGLLGTSGSGRRASFGEALANGMQQGTQGYRQAIGDRQRAQQIAAEQAAREQQMMLAREQMKIAQANAERDAQLFPGQLKRQTLGNEQTQAELDAQKAAAAQAAQLRALLGNLAGGGGGGGAMNAGPTLEGPPEPVAMPGGGGASSPEDYKRQIIRLVQSGQLPPAQGEALIKASDYGRQEVARTIETTGAGGVPMASASFWPKYRPTVFVAGAGGHCSHRRLDGGGGHRATWQRRGAARRCGDGKDTRCVGAVSERTVHVECHVIIDAAQWLPAK